MYWHGLESVSCSLQSFVHFSCEISRGWRYGRRVLAVIRCTFVGIARQEFGEHADRGSIESHEMRYTTPQFIATIFPRSLYLTQRVDNGIDIHNIHHKNCRSIYNKAKTTRNTHQFTLFELHWSQTRMMISIVRQQEEFERFWARHETSNFSASVKLVFLLCLNLFRFGYRVARISIYSQHCTHEGKREIWTNLLLQLVSLLRQLHDLHGSWLVFQGQIWLCPSSLAHVTKTDDNQITMKHT